MRTPRVRVVPYDPAWSEAFEAIRAEISAALGEVALGIEHVGSTSVPGLFAKPCIDIDVIIRDRTVLAEAVGRLATIGYIHEGDLGIPDREAFRYSDKPHLMEHHLYVCPQDSAELHRHIAFRDLLRGDAAAAERYGRVKLEAAGLFPDDIDGYIAHKAPCIEELYALCGLK